MPAAIHTNHRSFGSSSEQADTLIVELSSNNIGFCEFNSDINQPEYAVHASIDSSAPMPVRDQVISAVRHFRFSQKAYRAVYVNFFTGQFTLCPTPFFDEDHKRQLLEFNTGATGDAMILHDDLSPEIRLVYALDEQLKSTIDQLFPSHHIKHGLTVLSQLMLHSEDLSKTSMLAQLHDTFMALVVKQEGKLLLANQFDVNATEDILYYILFAMEQYQLDPMQTELTITGNSDAESDALLILKKYIRHVRLGMGNRSISWQAFTGMPQHFNYSLINRIFCES